MIEINSVVMSPDGRLIDKQHTSPQLVLIYYLNLSKSTLVRVSVSQQQHGTAGEPRSSVS